MATEILRPNGTGVEIAIPSQYPDDGSAHWTLVDEASPDNSGGGGGIADPPATGTLLINNERGTGKNLVFKRDLFHLTDPVTSESEIINKVTVSVRTLQNVSNFKATLRTYSTTYDFAQSGGSSTWTTFNYDLFINPSTKVAWTWTEVRALQAGVALSGNAATEAPFYWSCCTQVFVTITYGLVWAIVSTQDMTNIANTTATGNGNILDTGASAVTQHGHVWNTSGNPTTSDSKTQRGAGSAGAFTSSLTNLTAGTKYYVRSYATNTEGTVYGNEIEFTTGYPSVTTEACDSITNNAATGHGTVVALGASDVSQHGHVWSTTVDPLPDTSLSTKTQLGGKTTTGTFESPITGLTNNTLYYVRAYAQNGQGLSYGDVVSFTTLVTGDSIFYPTDQITRVTSIIHRYDRGVYNMEIGLGDLIAGFGVPKVDTSPEKSYVPKEEESLTLNVTPNIITFTRDDTAALKEAILGLKSGMTQSLEMKELQKEVEKLVEVASTTPVVQGYSYLFNKILSNLRRLFGGI